MILADDQPNKKHVFINLKDYSQGSFHNISTTKFKADSVIDHY